MSDPMTNREIEDVLSSIRRLVSQDGTKDARSDVVASPSATGTHSVLPTPPMAPGRLVLTAAQMVLPTPINDPAKAKPGAPGRDASHAGATDRAATAAPDHTATDHSALEATLAELEAAVSASGSAFEPETGETAPHNAPAPAPAPATATATDNVTSLNHRLSFLRGGSDAPADVSAEPRTEPRTVADADLGSDPQPAPAQPHTPTQTRQDTMADTASDEADIVLAEDADLVGDLNFDDTDIIDEATLRAMVAHIVREELHGQLGERITRSVRKLVRAEIARALDQNRYL